MLVSGVQKSNSVMCMCIFILFQTLFQTEYWVEFSVLYSRSLLVSYFISSSMLIPSSEFILPLPHISLFSKSVSPFLFCKLVYIAFFRFQLQVMSHMSDSHIRVPTFDNHVWVVSYDICLSLSFFRFLSTLSILVHIRFLSFVFSSFSVF